VSRKVLVLEDSAMMCSLYRMVLRDVAAPLLFAGDGIQGLDIAAVEADIDLFIVDVNLPRLDGLSFIRRLRSELGSGAPVVVVSTECEERDREAATSAGADAYLCKPWQPDELLDVVRSVARAP
jgi:two-component system, chemotaxis family, chemotaxis protein CheY